MAFAVEGWTIQGVVDVGQPAKGYPLPDGGVDPSGNMQYLKVDAAGNLQVSIGAVLAGTSFQVEGKQAAGAAITENPVLIAGQFGGNVKLPQLDAVGSWTVNQGTANGAGTNSWPIQGAAGAGGALAGNPLRMGISDGTNIQDWRQPTDTINAQGFTGVAAAATMLRNTGADLRIWATPANIGDANNATNFGAVGPWLFNGSTWDRRRNNVDVTLLASASRTTTQNSGPITTYNARGINVYVNITVIGTGSITLNILGVDPASGSTYTILASAALVANAFTVYKVYPGGVVAANVSANDHLPRVIQVNVVANNANAVTYSVGYTLLY